MAYKKHNKYGGSRKRTIREYFATVRSATTAWLAHANLQKFYDKEKKEITYRTRWSEFIATKFKSGFPAFNNYEHTNTVCNILDSVKAMPQFLAIVNKHAKNNHSGLIVEEVTSNMYKVATRLAEYQKDYSPEDFKAMLLSALKHCYPRSINRELQPWAICGMGSVADDVIDLLFTPMGDARPTVCRTKSSPRSAKVVAKSKAAAKVAGKWKKMRQ